MDRPDLTGRTALVTGSAKGLGSDCIEALASAGADVVVHYHTSEEEATALADALSAQFGVSSLAVGADVTEPDEVDALFSTIEAERGPVDLLVNNVGRFAPEDWETMDWDVWKNVLETNFNATCLCSKRALQTMRDAEYGRIVNIGYAGAEKGLVNPTNFPYFVAKTGVLMFTRMLAADTQHEGITVNAVSPYVIENSDAFPDTLPRGRAATTEDVIDPILFFMGGPEYISGENVEVDGGWLPESV
ncbi:SDR family NAD(P)-dependent oxidoreductase [Halocatena halophila]|uniref:SDR family NAD(P)-dependent oxidoreductase n=1 Tax=Halocatena halophila TaxID=2814576 RepID=UPI002ED575D7